MGIPQILLYLMIVIYFASFWKIFEKAGRQKWEGFIPGYNIWVWLKILNKPWWWIFFFPIPFVNFVITVACNVETARLFGKYDPKDTILTVLVPWYMIPTLAFKDENVIVEPTDWTKKDDREKRSIHDHITLFFMAPFIGHALLMVFKLTGSKDKANKKTMPKEWTDALGFAIVAATIIRVFFFEAFTIPTGSMEKTMLIGDYLFVNKLKYGAKIPQTPLSVPFVHNVLPGTTTKSYVEWFKNDYMRLPGYGSIERNDIMVFNWPAGDTVILHPDVIAHTYADIVRNEALRIAGGDILKFEQNSSLFLSIARKSIINGDAIANRTSERTGGIATRPVDKKENYIKRCVGVAGDSLEVIQGVLYVDGVAEVKSPTAQFDYHFYLSANFNDDVLKENFDINFGNKHLYEDGSEVNLRYFSFDPNTGWYNKIEKNEAITISCPASVYEQLSQYSNVDSSKVVFKQKGHDYAAGGSLYPIFPNNKNFNWTEDNYGPFYLPKVGDKIELTEQNFIFYRRAIEAYENNEVKVREGNYFINGEQVASYTFKQNYYWLMGDNRHGSADSRMWGYVPEDHVVGTASFVWFSKDADLGWFSGGVRWSRIFSFIK
jgi:signal peptidase I